MNCTHGGEATNIAPGKRCPWCLNIVAERLQVLATCGGEGAGSVVVALEAQRGFPAAHVAANPVSPTARAAAAAPGAALPPAPGAPIKHARNTDPDTARDAALSVSDAHKRRLYDHILALIFEHGPMTDYELAKRLTQRLGEPIIATSAGKRRGELRDMGLVFDTKFKGPTETGPRKGIRWGLTPAGEVEVAA